MIFLNIYYIYNIKKLRKNQYFIELEYWFDIIYFIYIIKLEVIILKIFKIVIKTFILK